VASGLGGLIGVGRTQKEQALAGLTRSAQLEAQKDIINQQLKAQKEAAVMNLAGTAGGITGAYMLANAGRTGAQLAAGGAMASPVAGGAAAATAAANPTAAALGLGGGTAGAVGATGAGAVGATGAGAGAAGAAGGAAGAGATGAMAAAAPWVALAIAGVYVLKKLFD
jgi:hypothetical protein